MITVNSYLRVFWSQRGASVIYTNKIALSLLVMFAFNRLLNGLAFVM